MMKIQIIPGTLAWQAYQTGETREPFNCNYELNPAYRSRLESAGLIVSGESEEHRARIVELPDHRFYLGTGFLPQLNSEPERPHPLIIAYLKAAAKQDE